MPYKDPEKKRANDRVNSATAAARIKAKAWKDAHRLHLREYNLKRLYGINLAEYERLLRSQRGVCAICKKPPTYKPLYVDHDHITKKVRGLLHDSCNRILGYAHEDESILQGSIEYLKTHRD